MLKFGNKMRDLFYFSKEKISIEQFAQLANEFGYKSIKLTHERLPGLGIIFDTTKVCWNCYEFDEEDFEDFGDEAEKIVREFAPKSVYYFSVSVDSWQRFATFLKKIFELYKGWAGSDTDDWKPIYTIENINMSEPIYNAIKIIK